MCTAAWVWYNFVTVNSQFYKFDITVLGELTIPKPRHYSHIQVFSFAINIEFNGWTSSKSVISLMPLCPDLSCRYGLISTREHCIPMKPDINTNYVMTLLTLSYF